MFMKLSIASSTYPEDTETDHLPLIFEVQQGSRINHLLTVNKNTMLGFNC